ncbi:MAG TPA: hypothetical protein DDW76_27985 [Cyanobacteria bacterium UBA11369]|nr:hypothetical protein [Cyanobacteria bacterium UBA11371]HBE20986.1 hypothetical protein [Cyanobacteria bacterium UBA11367]HBE33656.1 hypothetical protein [Cyanobacteria bacterium UBA11368]HBE52507.1 hypothetical protein [Cyanobacteria bacterium UBA11369]
MSGLTVERELGFNQRLATLIAELRGNRSYREFAETIGAFHSDVRRWEVELKGEPKLRVLAKIAALRGWTLDELMIYLEGEAPFQMLSITRLLAEVKNLPFEAAAEVAQAALETMAAKREPNAC